MAEIVIWVLINPCIEDTAEAIDCISKTREPNDAGDPPPPDPPPPPPLSSSSPPILYPDLSNPPFLMENFLPSILSSKLLPLLPNNPTTPATPPTFLLKFFFRSLIGLLTNSCLSALANNPLWALSGTSPPFAIIFSCNFFSSFADWAALSTREPISLAKDIPFPS